MTGNIDLIIGSFAKTFASNGGFVATHVESVKAFLKMFSPTNTFSNGISPMQVAIINAALKIVRSSEGNFLRDRLFNNAQALRAALVANGVDCMGSVSPIVPALVGNDVLSRIAAGVLERSGVFANLIEYPAVSPGTFRFRFQVMASHSKENADTAVKCLALALSEAQQIINLNK